ncbi:MAG: cytochrome c3 family protein [Nitrospirae bacterium]|nr:cytochrome c3 family protein [Nitrospirota bacterium]
MRWPIVVLIMFSLVLGCSPGQEKAKTENEQDKVISRDEAVGNLPCFKCHSYKTFSSAPRKGIFSHQIHINTGFHCNQCHDVRGHEHMIINRSLCNACHNIKEMTFKRSGLPSKFNHEAHAKKSGCRDCHPQIFVMKTGTAVITMKDINAGAYCGQCHNGKKAFSSSECTKCHTMRAFDKELTYNVEGLGNVTFSHKFHTSSFACSDCHPKHFGMQKTAGKMTMDKINEGKYCGACHNGTIASPATDCTKCHK